MRGSRGEELKGEEGEGVVRRGGRGEEGVVRRGGG